MLPTKGVPYDRTARRSSQNYRPVVCPHSAGADRPGRARTRKSARETADTYRAADLVELRLDPLPRQDWPTALAQVRAAITKPLIVTIRTAREGGEVDLTPTEYGEACQALLAQGSADALDIEWLADKTLTEELRDAAHRAGVSALFSEHHFGSTPDTGVMTDTLVGMLDLGADIAKLAVMPRNRADAARLLLATAQAAAQRPGKALITMSMGRDGAVTRYCGGAFGSAATFGTLSAASAPGQPPVTLLKEKLIVGEDL